MTTSGPHLLPRLKPGPWCVGLPKFFSLGLPPASSPFPFANPAIRRLFFPLTVPRTHSAPPFYCFFSSGSPYCFPPPASVQKGERVQFAGYRTLRNPSRAGPISSLFREPVFPILAFEALLAGKTNAPPGTQNAQARSQLTCCEEPVVATAALQCWGV